MKAEDKKVMLLVKWSIQKHSSLLGVFEKDIAAYLQKMGEKKEVILLHGWHISNERERSTVVHNFFFTLVPRSKKRTLSTKFESQHLTSIKYITLFRQLPALFICFSRLRIFIIIISHRKYAFINIVISVRASNKFIFFSARNMLPCRPPRWLYFKEPSIYHSLGKCLI